MVGCLGVLALVFLVWLAGAMLPKSESPPASVPVATIDKSPEKQAARRKIIDGCISAGVFSKIDVHSNGVPYLTVRRAFYQGDFEDKRKLVSVVYAYHLNGNSGDFIRILDARSGKTVGTYSAEGGLDLTEPK